MQANGNRTKLMPTIPFAVIHGHLHDKQDMTEMVRLLLEAGAEPNSVPEDMWINPLDKPQATTPESRKKYWVGRWCSAKARKNLARGLNLTQHNYLYRANQKGSIPTRVQQLTELHNVSDLLKLQYRMIGQGLAIEQVENEVIDRIADNVDMPTPLVMVFAGPPGHGKTELAYQPGNLLNVEHSVIPCSQMRSDMELLGSKQGYDRSMKGSSLNNHLAENTAREFVVFSDEADKSSAEIYASLLTIFSEGKYEDRRSNRAVDCRRTIWVLACNLGDEAISRFYEEKLKGKDNEVKMNTDLTLLIDELRDLCKAKFGEALESRIDVVVPFFPFDLTEQAVVAHKFFLETAANLRKDIDLRTDVKRHMGHCILSLEDDGKICAHMAEKGYSKSSGARGLRREVDRIRQKARKEYNAIPGRATEDLNQGRFERLHIHLRTSPNNRDEVRVFRRRIVTLGWSDDESEIGGEN